MVLVVMVVVVVLLLVVGEELAHYLVVLQEGVDAVRVVEVLVVVAHGPVGRIGQNVVELGLVVDAENFGGEVSGIDVVFDQEDLEGFDDVDYVLDNFDVVGLGDDGRRWLNGWESFVLVLKTKNTTVRDRPSHM